MGEFEKNANPISIVIICGVRPQYVKCAAFQQAISIFNSRAARKIDAVFINTAQHYDDQLSGVFIREFNLHFDLTLQHAKKDQAYILGSTISQLGEFLRERSPRPNWVTVFGDANSTLAGAIAANKSGFPIAHFEAGTAVKDLRTPEIVNGNLLAHLADVQFCSTTLASDSLKRQGIHQNIFVIGDVAKEFVLEFSSKVPTTLPGYEQNGFVLVTMHRAENLDSHDVLPTLLSILRNYSLPVLFVTHPRTTQRLFQLGITKLDNVFFSPPLSYSDMLSAIKGSKFIITDSGGLQREAYYLRKRCLICSDVDFWPSLRIGGVHRVVEPNTTSVSDGLKWVERETYNPTYPSIPEMDRTNAAFQSLEILDKLTP